MQKYLFTFILLCSSLYKASASDLLANNSKYPMTIEERKNKKIGTILDNSKVRRFFTKKNNQATEIKKINPDFIWQIIKTAFNDTAFSSVDIKRGIIITEPYKDKESEQILKANVFINYYANKLGEIIIVKIFQKNEDIWLETTETKKNATELKQLIDKQLLEN